MKKCLFQRGFMSNFNKKSWMVSNEDEACFRLLMIDSIFVTRTYIQVTQVFGILVTHGCCRHLCPTQLSQILFKIAWLLIFANSIQGKTKWRDCRLNIKTHIGLKWIWKVFLQYTPWLKLSWVINGWWNRLGSVVYGRLFWFLLNQRSTAQ